MIYIVSFRVVFRFQTDHPSFLSFSVIVRRFRHPPEMPLFILIVIDLIMHTGPNCFQSISFIY